MLQWNAHTHTHTTVWRPLVRDSPGRPVPEETLTHSHPSWSSDILYQLPPFTTIHSILYVQFTCLRVLFDNLSPGPLWSSSWSRALYFMHHAFFTQSSSVCSNEMLLPPTDFGTQYGNWLLLTFRFCLAVLMCCCRGSINFLVEKF